MSGSDRKYRVALLIISDRAAAGARADRCRGVVESLLRETSFILTSYQISSDDGQEIAGGLKELLAKSPDLLLTSGGTGCAPRDNTPEATQQFLERRTPGIDEAIRRFSAAKSQFALYSRGVSGLVGDTLIINLPGSPRAVEEILTFLLPTLPHPLDLLRGRITDCAGEKNPE